MVWAGFLNIKDEKQMSHEERISKHGYMSREMIVADYFAELSRRK